MKLRKGWYVVWPDGTAWFGDCPQWVAAARRPGACPPGTTITPVRVMGTGPAPCPACIHHTRH